MAEKTKKKTVARQTSAPAKKTQEDKYTGEILTICAGVLGIFIIVSLWFGSGGIVGKYLNLGLTGLFGCGAYTLPLALIGSAVCHYAVKDDSKSAHIAVLFLLVCMFVHYTFRFGVIEYKSSGMGYLWECGINSQGGGVIGGVLTDILWDLLGKVMTLVIIIAGGMIDIILLFNISVLTLIGKFFCYIGRSIKDSFTSLKESKDEESDVITLPDNITNDFDTYPDIVIAPRKEDEISINNPLDDITVNVGEGKPLEIKEQLPLSEEEQKEKIVPDTEIVKELDENKEKPIREYIFPSTDLLDIPAPATKTEKVEKLRENATKLLEILHSFGVEAKITNVTQGSSVTRYEVLPAAGVKISKITSLDQDIAMRLPAQNVRMEVLQGSVGIEASNDKVTSVYIREMIESKEFKSHPSKVAAALGRDIDGKVTVVDIAKMPHLLIAGTTGSGKSVCINAIVTSILYKSTPAEVRLVMVDPKAVELEMYNGIPHLLVPIVTDPRKAAGALCWAVNEMEERYKKFAELSVRNLGGYNDKMAVTGGEKLPQIVIIIDELADLMMVAPGEVQDYICRLAQKARAAGMHLILATQRPSVDVITGLIKANIPSRFSFQVSNHIDSRTIIDCGGAEKLMGRGDMLMMLAGSNKLVRVQGAFVSDGDVERVTSFIKQNCDSDYSEAVQSSIEGNAAGSNKQDHSQGENEVDELFEDAVDIAFELEQISTSMIQRRLKVGYARAGRLIDLMDKMGIISPYDGSNKPRTLRMSREQYYSARANQLEEAALED